MEGGESGDLFEASWTRYSKRMDPDKYVKFTECLKGLIQGTSVSESTSMLSVGVGKVAVAVNITEEIRKC